MGRGRLYKPHVVARARNDYENSDDSLPTIAARDGIPVRTFQRWAVEDGWKRRSERPLRDLPEATRLLEAVEALEAQAATLISAAPMDASPPSSSALGSGLRPVRAQAPADDPVDTDTSVVTGFPAFGGNDDQKASANAANAADVIGNAAPSPSRGSSPGQALLAGVESAERQVNAQLAIEESRARKRGGAPPTRAQAAETARTLATLTQTLQKLAALRRGETNPGETDHDESAHDIDERRRRLARRIHAFVDGRIGGRVDRASRSVDAERDRA